MKAKIVIIFILLIGGCAIWLASVAFVQTTTITNPKSATVSLDGPAKLKHGKTVTVQVRVDLSGVNATGSNQPATLGSYIIPISFDHNALEFVSAAGGDSPAFASSLLNATSVQAANANGLVTLVGAQTTSDTVSGTVGVASLQFRVIATEKGRTTININPELGAPGLSLASTARSISTGEPYRIAAVGEPSTFKIK